MPPIRPVSHFVLKFFAALLSAGMALLIVGLLALLIILRQADQNPAFLHVLLEQTSGFLLEADVTAAESYLGWSENREKIVLTLTETHIDWPDQASHVFFERAEFEVRYGWQGGALLSLHRLAVESPQWLYGPLPAAEDSQETAEAQLPPYAQLERQANALRHLFRGTASEVVVRNGIFSYGSVGEPGSWQVIDFALTFDKTTKYAAARGLLLFQENSVPLTLLVTEEQPSDRKPYLRLLLESEGMLLDSENMPLAPSLKVDLRFLQRARTLRLHQASLSYGEAQLWAKGRLTWSKGGLALEAEANGQTIPHKTFLSLWPETLGVNARTWLAENMHHGSLPTLSASARGFWPYNGQPIATDVSGTLSLKNYTITYAPGYPPVRNAAAEATFNKDGFIFDFSRGTSAGISLAGAKLVIDDMLEDLPTLDLALNLKSSSQQHISVLRQLPFAKDHAFLSSLLIEKGLAKTQLKLSFPLLMALRFEDIALSGTAQLNTNRWQVPWLPAPVESTKLRFDFSANDLRYSGTATYKNAAFEVSGETRYAPLSRTLNLKSNLPLSRLLAIADLPAHLQTLVNESGTVGVQGQYEVRADGSAQLTLNKDLRKAGFQVPWLAWDKPADMPLALRTTIDFNKQGTLTKAQLKNSGDQSRDAVDLELRFDTQQALQKIDLKRLQLGRHDLQATASKEGSQYAVDVQAKSLDVSGLLANDMSSDEPGGNSCPPLNLVGGVDQIWLQGNQSINTVNLVFRCQDDLLQAFSVQGTLAEKPLTVVLENTEHNGKPIRNLRLKAGHAGALFHGLTDQRNIRDGSLEATLVLPGKDDAPYEISLMARDFLLRDAPMVAKVLSIASVVGSFELLVDQGLNFSVLHIQGTYAAQKLFVQEAYMRGASIGMQLSGAFDLSRKRFQAEGAVVPAYVLTELVGSIPVLGKILTDDKGGLMAVHFEASGPFADPQVEVKPLKSLTPGFLRGLADLF